MQQIDTHASQLFKIMTIPRLLKIVAETLATQNNHHIPAAIVQDTDTQHESATIVPDESASLSISPGTKSGMHNFTTETSLTLVSAHPRRHHMITRAQTGNLKPKVFMSSRHPIPACFVVDLVAQPQEPSSTKHALKHPKWFQAMQAEMDALHINKTWTLVPR